MTHRTSIKRQNLGSLSGGARWQWFVRCQDSECSYADYAVHWSLALIMANYHSVFRSHG